MAIIIVGYYNVRFLVNPAMKNERVELFSNQVGKDKLGVVLVYFNYFTYLKYECT